MSVAPWKKFTVAAVVLALVTSLLALAPPTNGQDAGNKKKAVAKAPAKGRLPPYYRDIVTPDQRDRIYELQAKFDAQIDELTTQLEDLRAQREAEVEAVLNAEQKSQLAEARAAAGSKKKKKAAGSSTKTTVESEKKSAVGK